MKSVFLVYDAKRLAVATINQLLETCAVLSKDVPFLRRIYDGYLSIDSDKRYSDKYVVSDCVIKNDRRTQEDRHVCVQNTAPLFGLEVRIDLVCMKKDFP